MWYSPNFKSVSLQIIFPSYSGDVILTYSDSHLIEKLLLDAAKEKKFKVIVSDGRVQFSGELQKTVF